MFVRIDCIEEELVLAVNKHAMEELGKSPLGYWPGTEKYIDHIFCAGSVEALEDVREILGYAGIHVQRIRKNHFVDEIGVSHTIFEMAGEDKLLLTDSVITHRILAVFDLLEKADVEYIGWKCSDSAGMSNSPTDQIDTYTLD